MLVLVKAKAAVLKSQAKVELKGHTKTMAIKYINNPLLFIVNLFAWLLATTYNSMRIKSQAADSGPQDWYFFSS